MGKNDAPYSNVYIRPHSIHKIREPFRSLTGISLTSSCSNTCLTEIGYKSSYKLACFCFNLKNVRICNGNIKIEINIFPKKKNKKFNNNNNQLPVRRHFWGKICTVASTFLETHRPLAHASSSRLPDFNRMRTTKQMSELLLANATVN